jgi:3-oxoacyl-[acyl-carrier-protein] synthase-3
MYPLPIAIAGLGAYLPARVVANPELEEALGLEPGWIERTTGVCERRYAHGEASAAMAAAAARRALAAAGRDVAEVDLIVGASSAPQQAIPCTAALVQRELGAPDGRSACFDVNATCVSFLVALHTAAHLVAAGAHRCALVFSSEICGHSRNPAEPESAVLFGDAAAAAVITRAEPGATGALWGAKFATYGSGAALTEIRGGGTLHHPNDPTTTPEMNHFHMHGPGVLRLAARTLGPFLDGFFTEVGWDQREVELLVPHQASRNGLGLLTARLGFTPAQLFLNLAGRGNCVAASVPLALAEAAEQGRLRRGDRVVLLGTGAGMTIGALALTF